MGKPVAEIKSAYFHVTFEGGKFDDRWALLDKLEEIADFSDKESDGVKIIKVEKYVER